MLRKLLFSILFVVLLGSAFIYRLIDSNLNETVSKSLTTSSKPLSNELAELEAPIVFPERIKRKIISERKQKASEKVAEKTNELMAEVGQKIFYNRETKQIEKSKKIKKTVEKIIKKPVANKKKAQKPQTYSKPLYAPEELSSEKMEIDSSKKFVHTGYKTNLDIKVIDLVIMAESILKDSYYTEKTEMVAKTEIVPEELSKTVEEDEAFEVVLKEEISKNDELTYRFSANKKDFKFLKDKPVEEAKPTVEEPEKLDFITEISTIENPINPEKQQVDQEPETEVIKSEPVPAVTEKKEAPVKNDELVFFDYSDDVDYSTGPTGPKEIKKVEPEYSKGKEAALTTQILQRSAPIEPTKPAPGFFKVNPKKKNDRRIADNSNPHRFTNTKPKPKPDPENPDNDGTSTLVSPTEESVVDIEALYVFSTGEEAAKSPFEVVFADNGNRFDSSYQGFIKVPHELNRRQSTRRGRISSSDFIPTVVDFAIKRGEEERYLIPLFSRKFWFELIDREKADEFKAALLIKKDEDFSVYPEGIKQDPILFTEDFEYVTDIKEASYYLYLDLLPGNITLRYEDNDGEGFKEAHLQGGAIYFESPKADIQDITVAISERELLSTTAAPLDLPEQKIRQMYLNSKPIKRGVHVYEFEDVLIPNGSRTYVQIYNEAEVDIGLNSIDSDIEIPSKGFKEEVFRKLDLREPKGFCVIQLNLPNDKKLDSIEHRGEGIQVEGDESKVIHTEHHAFDNDGTFYTEIGDNTEKVFIIAEGTGVVSINLEYTDESTDHVLGICDSSYTVESLSFR